MIQKSFSILFVLMLVCSSLAKADGFREPRSKDTSYYVNGTMLTDIPNEMQIGYIAGVIDTLKLVLAEYSTLEEELKGNLSAEQQKEQAFDIAMLSSSITIGNIEILVHKLSSSSTMGEIFDKVKSHIDALPPEDLSKSSALLVWRALCEEYTETDDNQPIK